jgi:hypothetical protein
MQGGFMFDTTSIGKWIMLAGIIVFLVGGAFWLVGRLGLPLGRLPGDIRIQNGNFSFYFPIVTSIVLSIVLTIVINLLARFFSNR